MDKSDPINLPTTVTVALRHKIMTRRIAQQLGEVQYMLKQGSSWHDITDYYRARKKAVSLRVELGDKGVTSSPKKVRMEKSYKKDKGSRRTSGSLKDPIQITEAEPSYCFDTCY